MMNRFEFCKRISALQHIEETDWPPNGAAPLFDGQCCFLTRTGERAEAAPSRMCRFLVRSGEDPTQMRLQLALACAAGDHGGAAGTLYARIDGEPFIVDHGRIEQIACPKPRATDVGHASLDRAVRRGDGGAGRDCAQLEPSSKRQKLGDVASSHVPEVPQRATTPNAARPLPPYASLAFGSIVLRFWAPLQVAQLQSSHDPPAAAAQRAKECPRPRSREKARRELIVAVNAIVANLRRRTPDNVASAGVGGMGRAGKAQCEELRHLRQWLVGQRPLPLGGGALVQGVDIEALTRAIDVSHSRWLHWMRQSLVAHARDKHAHAASLASPVGESKTAADDEAACAWASLLSPMLHTEVSAACPCSPALAGCALKLFNAHLRERQAALRTRVEALGAQHRRQRAGDCCAGDTLQDGECKNNQGGCRLVARAAAEVDRLVEDVRRAHVAVAQCTALSSR